VFTLPITFTLIQWQIYVREIFTTVFAASPVLSVFII